LQQALRDRGMSSRKANDLLALIDDDTIDAAVVEVKASAKLAGIAAIGDGKIIGWLIEFFNSPLGKALIEFLLGLLLGGFSVTTQTAEV
jgi:F0F1-type ATP synthase assembly protein I